MASRKAGAESGVQGWPSMLTVSKQSQNERPHKPACLQPGLSQAGLGRNLPLRQTPDSALIRKTTPLTAPPRPRRPGLSPSCPLMPPSLFSLRLQAAHTGSDSRPRQDWVLSLEPKALT